MSFPAVQTRTQHSDPFPFSRTFRFSLFSSLPTLFPLSLNFAFLPLSRFSVLSCYYLCFSFHCIVPSFLPSSAYQSYDAMISSSLCPSLSYYLASLFPVLSCSFFNFASVSSSLFWAETELHETNTLV